MVYDNGTGIPKEKLKELNDRLKKTEEHPLEYIEQYKSLGILNVHLRSDFSMEKVIPLKYSVRKERNLYIHEDTLFLHGYRYGDEHRV